ncbi:MAG: hypothetical protein WAZ19_10455, partial [Anaerolineae bacterium]
DLAVEHEIVTKRGAFFSYGDTRLGQGRENAKAFLQENEAIFNSIAEQIRKTAGLSGPSIGKTAEE